MVKFVVEVGSNHTKVRSSNRDLDRALAFIDTAARIGCDSVKFQLFRVDKLFAPEALRANPELLKRREWELPIYWLPLLAERCTERGIEFACTPLYLEAVEELRPYVAFYKIASYSLLHDDLLRAVAATGKPVVLSTGVAHWDEVERAVNVLVNGNSRHITLLHCVSRYPASLTDCNLDAIRTFSDRLGFCWVGWSDHSVNRGVIYSAVFRYNASTIEFHLDLDGMGAEFDAGHCWLPSEIEAVIRAVRDGEQAAGDGVKRPTAAEMAERDWRSDPADGLRPMRAMRERLLTPVAQ